MAQRTTEFDPEARARQLRRRAIVLAKLQGAQYSDRWIPARAFLVVKDDQGEAIGNEDEAIEILDHLAELKLVEEWHAPGIGGKTQSFAQRRFRLTDRGYGLWAQELEPIPSIADERLGD